MLNLTEHEISTAHKNENAENEDFSSFQTLRCCIYHANKNKNYDILWHFNIYEYVKCYDQLSEA